MTADHPKHRGGVEHSAAGLVLRQGKIFELRPKHRRGAQRVHREAGRNRPRRLIDQGEPRIQRPHDRNFLERERRVAGDARSVGARGDQSIRLDRHAVPPVAVIVAVEISPCRLPVEYDDDFVLAPFEGGEAEIGRARHHALAPRAREQIELLMARFAAQQPEPQRASGNPIQQQLSGAAKQPGEGFDKRLLVRQGVGEAIGLDRLAGLRECQMFLGQNALRTEHDLHVVDAVGQAEQELEAAGERDRLERVEARKHVPPRCLIAAEELGTKDRERLAHRLQIRNRRTGRLARERPLHEPAAIMAERAGGRQPGAVQARQCVFHPLSRYTPASADGASPRQSDRTGTGLTAENGGGGVKDGAAIERPEARANAHPQAVELVAIRQGSIRRPPTVAGLHFSHVWSGRTPKSRIRL